PLGGSGIPPPAGRGKGDESAEYCRRSLRLQSPAGDTPAAVELQDPRQPRGNLTPDRLVQPLIRRTAGSRWPFTSSCRVAGIPGLAGVQGEPGENADPGSKLTKNDEEHEVGHGRTRRLGEDQPEQPGKQGGAKETTRHEDRQEDRRGLQVAVLRALP